MGTLQVNGAISATGTISASSFLGNASSATYTYQWASTETNPSTSSTDSNTTTFNKSNSRIYWVDSSGVVLNQPSTLGYILDIGNNAERHQIWMTQNIGSLYHRGGNAQGWGCAWTEILDASNYTSYTVTKTGGGASGTWNISINGNAHNANYLDGYDATSFAMASHNHTSLNNITSLSFLTHSDDGAQIISRVSDTITCFDFELWDDGSSDMFRWRFERWDSATSSGVPINLMTLTTTSATSNTANLVVNGNITASNFYGTLDWSNISNKPTTFTPSGHNHNLLTAGGEGSIANTRNNHYTCAVLSGGWASSSAGYSTTYGTTLDISGYSTWYHRLAFGTNGTIEYWHGINTNTMSRIGYLLTTANYTSYCAPASHSHSYASLGSPNNLMHSGNEFTFAPDGYNGVIWLNYRTAGWSTNGNIGSYIFGNGKGSIAPIEHLYDITHNYGSGAPGSSTPGYGTAGAIYYQT